MTEFRENTLLAEARCGNQSAREALINQYRTFVARVASDCCRRPLDWHNDDELSLSLIAFNEAINTFDQAKGMSFLNYARLLIRRKLIDHYRREKKNLHLPFETVNDNGELYCPYETKKSLDEYAARDIEAEREEEVRFFTDELRVFGISMLDLVTCSPKHRDTRQNLFRVARLLSQSPLLLAFLQKNRQLPVKELVEAAGVSRKVIESGRKYIIAVTLVLINPEYEHIRSFIDIPGEKGGAS